MSPHAPTPPRCVIVVPCLNERAHIGPLLDALGVSARVLRCEIVVADGGSTDGTQGVVLERARAEPRIRLVHNPRRIQSAAVNGVVANLTEDADYLIRIDAHGGYPPGYCEALVAEAERTGADSVVVSMLTTGRGRFQSAVAAAQNSALGTGGSRHRVGSAGRWIDHGHHALMRIAAFRAVGGYDENFSHNEDAELDHRLVRAGYRIWMTDETRMTYYPRASAGALFRQYLGYGRGRARNLLKHRSVPKLRQALPLLVAPALVLAVLAPLAFALLAAAAPAFAPLALLLALPALAWALGCLALGLLDGARRGSGDGLLVGFAAMVMHLAWSAGFWRQLLAGRAGSASRPQGVPA